MASVSTSTISTARPPGPLTIHDMFSKTWTAGECSKCLDALKEHFAEQETPKQYDHLLGLITGWRCGRVESTELVLQCSRMLYRTPRLLRDINSLLKRAGEEGVAEGHLQEELKIICRVDRPQVDCVVAVYARGGKGEDGSRHGDCKARTAVIHAISSPAHVLHDVQASTLFSSRELEEDGCLSRIHAVDEHLAPYMMELLQLRLESDSCNVLLRRKLIQCMRHLNKVHGALPPSIVVHDITREGDHPITGGGFADIWKGRRNGRLVCLKVLRIFTSSSDRSKLFKDLSNEVLIWKQLHHKHILPLYGVNMELFQPSYCIVSPWMSNGDVGSYLSKSADESSFDKKISLITEIAEGLSYLHELDPPVIHGDIKCSNVLISDDCHCRLADFGLSVIETQTKSYNITSSANNRGSIRWLAPELMNPDSVHTDMGYSKTRDIYAFACTVVEILTGRPPFPEYKMDLHVMIQVLKGNRPPRPSDCSEDVWELTQQCWAERTTERPSAADVVRILKSSGSSTLNEAAGETVVVEETKVEAMVTPSHNLFDILPPIRYAPAQPVSALVESQVPAIPGVSAAPLPTLEAIQQGLFRSNSPGRMEAMAKLTGSSELYDPSLPPSPTLTVAAKFRETPGIEAGSPDHSEVFDAEPAVPRPTSSAVIAGSVPITAITAQLSSSAETQHTSPDLEVSVTLSTSAVPLGTSTGTTPLHVHDMFVALKRPADDRKSAEDSPDETVAAKKLRNTLATRRSRKGKLDPMQAYTSSGEEFSVPPLKRGRGRPKRSKNKKTAIQDISSSSGSPAVTPLSGRRPKPILSSVPSLLVSRKRGRPPKMRPEEEEEPTPKRARGQLPIQHLDDAAPKETQYLRRRCFNCNNTKPPSWRRSALNPGEILCNKCGLYERCKSSVVAASYRAQVRRDQLFNLSASVLGDAANGTEGHQLSTSENEEIARRRAQIEAKRANLEELKSSREEHLRVRNEHVDTRLDQSSQSRSIGNRPPTGEWKPPPHHTMTSSLFSPDLRAIDGSFGLGRDQDDSDFLPEHDASSSSPGPLSYPPPATRLHAMASSSSSSSSFPQPSPVQQQRSIGFPSSSLLLPTRPPSAYAIPQQTSRRKDLWVSGSRSRAAAEVEVVEAEAEAGTSEDFEVPTSWIVPNHRDYDDDELDVDNDIDIDSTFWNDGGLLDAWREY